MILTAALLAASAPWPVYANGRYGYAVCYPSALFKAEPEADNGDGRRFSGRNGAQMLVFGQYDAMQVGLKNWASEQAAHYAGKHGRISRRESLPGAIALAGDDGLGKAFFMLTRQREDVFATVQLSYSRQEAARYKPIIARLKACFQL